MLQGEIRNMMQSREAVFVSVVVDIEIYIFDRMEVGRDVEKFYTLNVSQCGYSRRIRHVDMRIRMQ